MNGLIEMPCTPHDKSNAWAYRDAFLIKFSEDIPIDFRAIHRKSCERFGDPIMAFFSPAACSPIRNSLITSPPRIILLFPEMLFVITGTHNSRHTTAMAIPRARLIAYGIAEFGLNCWLTLYHGVDASEAAMIVFPTRAADFYGQLSRNLWTWLARDNEQCYVRPKALSFFPVARLPRKFSRFLQNHPEISLRPQSFRQTGVAVSRSHTPFWPNLLLGLANDKMAVLCDQYDGYPSKCGLEATVLALAAIKRITWVEQKVSRQARIAIKVGQQGRTIWLSWPASPDQKSPAMGWIERANASLSPADQRMRLLPQLSPRILSTETVDYEDCAGQAELAQK